MSLFPEMIQETQTSSSPESRNNKIWGIFITQGIPIFSHLLQLKLKSK